MFLVPEYLFKSAFIVSLDMTRFIASQRRATDSSGVIDVKIIEWRIQSIPIKWKLRTDIDWLTFNNMPNDSELKQTISKMDNRYDLINKYITSFVIKLNREMIIQIYKY